MRMLGSTAGMLLLLSSLTGCCGFQCCTTFDPTDMQLKGYRTLAWLEYETCRYRTHNAEQSEILFGCLFPCHRWTWGGCPLPDCNQPQCWSPDYSALPQPWVTPHCGTGSCEVGYPPAYQAYPTSPVYGAAPMSYQPAPAMAPPLVAPAPIEINSGWRPVGR